MRELVRDGFDTRGDEGEGIPDLDPQGVVEDDRVSQVAHFAIRQRSGRRRQDVLQNLDRRAQADAARPPGEATEQPDQDLELGGWERVEVDEALYVRRHREITGQFEFGVEPDIARLLFVAATEVRLGGVRLRQEASIADLPDIAGLEVNVDGEAILKLIEVLRVQRRRVFGQDLLGGRDEPDLALADVLDVPG